MGLVDLWGLFGALLELRTRFLGLIWNMMYRFTVCELPDDIAEAEPKSMLASMSEMAK